MPGRETSYEIDAQAAEWATRVDRAPLTAQEQADLDAWTAADPRRLGAYAKARAMFVLAGRARALGPNFNPDAFVDDEPGDVPDIAAETRRGLGRRKLLGLTGVAAAVVAAGSATLALRGRLNPPMRFSTKRGEVRLFALPDSSTITLNTASVVEIQFDVAQRLVKLVAGEALFDVVKDASRPFIVQAGDTLVRAVGTSFTVSHLDKQPIQVLVREGIVEVTRRSAVMTKPVKVVANMRASAVGSIAVEAAPVPAPQIVRELAWREGMLSFEDMRLDRAAAEFARYSDTKIIIDDPAVAAETVTGLFSANNPYGFADAVAATLDLRAEIAPGEVKLRR